jgi:2-dehydro-3-deoxyphosphogluconate aldolase/(4S)-4-hydroxy-2-oxoglutarate aldolase
MAYTIAPLALCTFTDCGKPNNIEYKFNKRENKMTRLELTDTLKASGVVAVIRMQDSQKLLQVADAIQQGGVTAIEITMTTPNALRVIEELSRKKGDELQIGVGSVLNAETARRAIDAGAQFVVSPILKKEIIDAAHDNDIAVMPGAFSPTEIQKAFEWGADIIKVFPADVLGMAFFKGVKAPMPHLNLMPTGGVSLTNAGDWLRAGASAVGVGSALLDKEAIEQANYKKLTENAQQIKKSILSARS